ncbi:Fc.00g092680.m01.CDS01 [Cosmosporella sp. VM-42]
MLPRIRSSFLFGGVITLALLYLWSTNGSPQGHGRAAAGWRTNADDTYFWKTLVTHYPPASVRPLPKDAPKRYPRVQATFSTEPASARKVREKRQHEVKETFAKCWAAYKEHAWLSDELAPVSGGKKNTFGGWAATLVDSLDTLWIMGMRAEFDEAVAAAETIDFTHTDLKDINVFETTIRYLGGFLAAFDLSGDLRLLRKAVQVGEMVYKAFDTPNRMPITRWDVHAAAKGTQQTAPTGILLAEIGSLSMEFTRLSQLTGDPKWFDAVQRIVDELAAQQDTTSLPGLWPLVVNAQTKVFNSGTAFTLGAMADSVYEYLPKMAALMGGQLPMYQTMYEKAMTTAVKYSLFRPMTPTDEDILISGQVHATETNGSPDIELEPQGQHLVCFLGGLFALGGKLFGRSEDLDVANKLVDGCVWTYEAFPHGIMPETFFMAPCKDKDSCHWDEKVWKQEALRLAKEKAGGEKTEVLTADSVISMGRLPQGFTAIPDRRYILRPEAIESVFILYRATGREDLVESAWDMFTAINDSTSTKLANSAVWDVTTATGTKLSMADSMESFWMGETLKYFYLIFSDPSLISLDEYVFNTEAHPFKRLV